MCHPSASHARQIIDVLWLDRSDPLLTAIFGGTTFSFADEFKSSGDLML